MAQAIVLDDVSAVGALRRSFSLTKGYWWRVFGVFVLVLAVVEVVTLGLNQGAFAIELGFQSIPGVERTTQIALGAFLMAVIGLVVYPVTLIAATLMYYDLRARKEDFDLETLALAIEPKPLPGVPHHNE